MKELVRRGIPNHLRGIAWQVNHHHHHNGIDDDDDDEFKKEIMLIISGVEWGKEQSAWS